MRNWNPYLITAIVFLALALIAYLIAITTGSWALGISVSALLLSIVNLTMIVSDSWYGY